jgi:hypothetical protein
LTIIHTCGNKYVGTVPDKDAFQPWLPNKPAGYKLSGSCGHDSYLTNKLARASRISHNEYYCEHCKQAVTLEHLQPLPPSAFSKHPQNQPQPQEQQELREGSVRDIDNENPYWLELGRQMRTCDV